MGNCGGMACLAPLFVWVSFKFHAFLMSCASTSTYIYGDGGFYFDRNPKLRDHGVLRVSRSKGFYENADGSYDVYFDPKPSWERRALNASNSELIHKT